MNINWEIKRLGDVVDFQRGLTYSKSDEVDFSHNIVLRSNNVKLETNNLDFSELKYIKPEIVIPESKKVKKGSLIICTANGSKIHLGKVALIDDDYDYAFGGFMGLITPKQNLNPTFLFYLMTSHSYKKFIGELSDGANINNLKFGSLAEFKIPIPPLPDQKRIVAILDQAFAAIAKAKANAVQNLKNAKELFESYLQGVFEKKGEGWEYARLGDICQINDGTHFSPKNTDKGEYMYITAKNIKPYFIDLTKISYISEKDHQSIYTRCSPMKGDVLYIKDGATAGIAAINTLDEEFSLLSSVALLKCSPKINNSFLVHYMNSSTGKRNFLGYIDGAAITRLTLVKIKNVCFPLPPIKIQQAIARKFDDILAETKKLEAIYQRKINNLEELKKSILQKAFSGELTKTEVIS